MRRMMFWIPALAVSALFACAGGEGSLESDQLNPDGEVVDGDGAWANAPIEANAPIAEEVSEAQELQLGQLQQALGGSCGSKSNIFNKIVTRVAVPDIFPPESILAQLAAQTIGFPFAGLTACIAFGVAELSPTCEVHDACYATFGASKAACDRDALSGWERSCRATYADIDTLDVALGFLTGGVSSTVALAEQGCRSACLQMVNTMASAVSAGGQGAFDAAQREASRPTADAFPDGPVFF